MMCLGSRLYALSARQAPGLSEVADEATDVVVSPDEEDFERLRGGTEEDAELQASAAFEDVFAQSSD